MENPLSHPLNNPLRTALYPLSRNCCVCGNSCELVEYQFPTRQLPHRKHFWHALYFSDPFFGGDDSGYCGPECSFLDWKKKQEKNKEINEKID
jgi:hypothetical protein